MPLIPRLSNEEILARIDRIEDNINQILLAKKRGEDAIENFNINLVKHAEEAEREHYAALAKIRNPIAIQAEKDHNRAMADIKKSSKK